MVSTEISVIIPVYNDPEGLRETLKSLVDQDFSKSKYEILPVDNNSTDNTGEVIEEFEKNYPNLVRGLQENEIQSSYAARNKGIEESEGDILVFTDADMWIGENTLTKVKKPFINLEIDYFGCPIRVVNSEENIYSDGGNQFEDVEERFRKENYVPTAFLAVRKEVVEKVGKFDDRLSTGGDRVFGRKVHEAGRKQSFNKEIQAFHPARSTFQSKVERKLRRGRAYYELKKFHSRVLKNQRHPLNIRNFLPTLPNRLRKESRNWTSYNKKEKIKFYMLYWLEKILYPVGYLKAFLRDQ